MTDSRLLNNTVTVEDDKSYYIALRPRCSIVVDLFMKCAMLPKVIGLATD